MNHSNQNNESHSSVTSKGGATSFPMMNPRPKPLQWGPILLRQLPPFIRGPVLAIAFTKFVTYPVHRKLLKIMDQYKFSDAFIFATVCTIYHAGTYAVVNSFFLSLDYFKLLQRFKLPRAPAQEPSWTMIGKTCLEFLISQPIAFMGFMSLYQMLLNRGAPSVRSPLPKSTTLFKNFAAAAILFRFLFYVIHRTLHSKYLYKKVHKKHHNYIGTVSVAAEHSHPLEAITANVIPIVSGCLLTNAHPVVWCTWLAWKSEGTYEAHSGYAFSGTWLHKMGLTHSDESLFHNSHHMDNQGAFGDEFLDRLLGTMDHWTSRGGYDKVLQDLRSERQKMIQEQQ